MDSSVLNRTPLARPLFSTPTFAGVSSARRSESRRSTAAVGLHPRSLGNGAPVIRAG
jgi:hypothetical protein